ncbi:MAG: hypothetical protein AAF203_05795 [Pseudomonadota bacterium]
MGSKAINLKLWLGLGLFLVFAFTFPRLLLKAWGPADPWTNYLYLYGFGFFYTGSGLFLVLKTGACNLSRTRDRFWFKITVGGFFYFASLHALWIYLSLSIPYLGGQ